jgi:hypothetical protein
VSNKVTIYRDEKNGLILFEIGGSIVAKMTISEWSFALANPKRINADIYNFGREPA